MSKRTWIIIGVVVLAGIIVGAVVASRSGSAIRGTSWQWTSMKETAPASQSVVPDPASYTITFNDDGSFDGQADCNMFSGTYTESGGKITLLLGPTTLAECGPQSLYNTYLAKLGIVEGYDLQGNDLILKFGGGAGEMIFKSQ